MKRYIKEMLEQYERRVTFFDNQPARVEYVLRADGKPMGSKNSRRGFMILFATFIVALFGGQIEN